MPTSGPPRVLVVGKGSPDRGGIPTFLTALVGSDLAATHGLRLLNVARGGTREGGRFTSGNLGRTLADAAAVWRHSRAVDVVHVHSALAPTTTVLRAGLLALAARARRRRVIVHGHGGRIPLWLTTPARRAVARLALAPAHRVVAVSDGGRDALAAVAGTKVVVVDNGVDTDRFRPAPDRAPAPVPRILYVGLLTPRKGVTDLFQASSQLLERGVQHELALVGGPPDEGPDAEAEVRAAAPGHARFLGVLDHDAMPAVYAEADVFCLPSWWEAAPLSLLEAMAAGLPAVATAVGDVPRLAPDGEAALLVPPRSPGDLAGALERLLRDPAERARLGQAARQRAVARFSLTAMTGALATLYGEVAA